MTCTHEHFDRANERLDKNGKPLLQLEDQSTGDCTPVCSPVQSPRSCSSVNSPRCRLQSEARSISLTPRSIVTDDSVMMALMMEMIYIDRHDDEGPEDLVPKKTLSFTASFKEIAHR